MSLFEPLEKSYWLGKVCEANFAKLSRLFPSLSEAADCCVAFAQGKPDLYLALLEDSRYTLTLRLSHRFGEGFAPLQEPAVTVRVYRDARTAEVLSDHARPPVCDALDRDSRAKAVMEYKWTLNYFLYQWLEHCLACDYRNCPPPASQAFGVLEGRGAAQQTGVSQFDKIP